MAKKKSNIVSKKKPVKNKSKSRKKKKRKFNILKFTGKIIAFFFLLGSLFFILVFLGILGPVPSKQLLQQINNPVASEVYSIDRKILGRYYLENRSNADFDEISLNVINALVATEDARFYEHRGIDEIALIRVFVKSILLQNRSAGGGSTLSQQVAKNLYPRGDYGPISIPVNKLREAIIAYRLERIYTKEEVLAMYLNTVPFAENIFGIEVASERFFSKKPLTLDVHEAAVLIGMLKANNYYNPRTHAERAIGRRNVVIDQMTKYEYITPQEADDFKAKPLGIKYRVISYNQGPAPYFLEKLKPQLLEWCKNNVNEDEEPYNLYTDGLKIKTSIDYNLQVYAQQSVKEYMKDLQRVFDSHWSKRDIFQENPDILKSAILNTSEAQKKIKNGFSYAGILEQYRKEKNTTLFTWNGLSNKNISRLDSLKHYLKLLNAGFIALNPSNGELKAWVGGIDYRFFQYDHVTAPRQTGSVFKPFVYLAALENGIAPDHYFVNQHKVYKDYNNWAPRNSHNDYGGYYTMKGALAKSLNTVSVDVLLETGISNAIELVEDLGITTELPDYPSLALGVASISLKEIMEAYASIVNDGRPVETHYLLEISDKNGNKLTTFNYKQKETQVATTDGCRAVINMLEAVVDGGTGRGIRTIYGIPGDFAGKTGTTQNNSDGWFIGLTPNLVTGCWVGADDPRVHFRTTTLGQGAYMAMPIVGKFFKKTYKDAKYTSLKTAKFKSPEPELLALLNSPQYKDVLEIEKKPFDITQIFKKNKEEGKLGEREKRKRKVEPKEKGRVWKKIKNIFKKKEKR